MKENNKLVGSAEKDQAILDAVGKACVLPNFHATIYNTGAKSIT